MVWEEARSGNLEICYATATAETLLSEVRITNSRGESSYPCVACDSRDVYILWEETKGKVSDISYVRLRDGKEVARKTLTRTFMDSSCPVSAVGPGGTLHIAWHEGPYKQTAVYYGKIVGDSMVIKEPICTIHPEAFRPDIACDREGRILVVWFEGLEVKAKYWNGEDWSDEQLAAVNRGRPYRLSVADLGNGIWAITWFDNTEEGSDVFAKLFDGDKWYGQVQLDDAEIAYYPNVTRLNAGECAVVWEERDLATSEYMLVLRCYNGSDWSDPLEIYRESMAGRYASMVLNEDELHAVWFSSKMGNDEIFHGLLRRK
jgi:hypothetical protein